MIGKLTKLIGSIKKIFGDGESIAYQTFTYFIPAPPERKTGYREKQFDQIVHQFLKKGYEIASINTESISGSCNGMWITLLLKTKNEISTNDLSFPEILEDHAIKAGINNEQTEGIYYID